MKVKIEGIEMSKFIKDIHCGCDHARDVKPKRKTKEKYPKK